jgi:hypothetical protein
LKVDQREPLQNRSFLREMRLPRGTVKSPRCTSRCNGPPLVSGFERITSIAVRLCLLLLFMTVGLDSLAVNPTKWYRLRPTFNAAGQSPDGGSRPAQALAPAIAQVPAAQEPAPAQAPPAAPPAEKRRVRVSHLISSPHLTPVTSTSDCFAWSTRFTSVGRLPQLSVSNFYRPALRVFVH